MRSAALDVYLNVSMNPWRQAFGSQVPRKLVGYSWCCNSGTVRVAYCSCRSRARLNIVHIYIYIYVCFIYCMFVPCWSCPCATISSLLSYCCAVSELGGIGHYGQETAWTKNAAPASGHQWLDLLVWGAFCVRCFGCASLVRGMCFSFFTRV